MANLKKCKRCGRAFSGESLVDFCSACTQKSETVLESAKQFLIENPESSLEYLSEAIKIDIDELLHFFREGNLLLKGQLSDSFLCESCGGPIRSGRYCHQCASKMSQDLKSAFREGEKEKNDDLKGVYHIDLHKKRR